jgi:hypothetical protein
MLAIKCASVQCGQCSVKKQISTHNSLCLEGPFSCRQTFGERTLAPRITVNGLFAFANKGVVRYSFSASHSGAER